LGPGCPGQPGKCHGANKGNENKYHHNSFHKLEFTLISYEIL
jgi:hypothetical protein